MKSTTGRAKNLMIFLVVFIISIFILKQVGIVIAQNESNISGYVISNVSNFTETIDNFSFRNETFSFNFTENITENITENVTLNETELNITENVTENVTENITENITENVTLNETSSEDLIINETLENETIIPNETNETSQEPVITNFDINLIYPQKITRGEIINVKASATNLGSTARNVVLIWKLPDDFETISGYLKEFCGTLELNDVCSSEISLKTNFSTPLGLNEIKVVVSYEA